MTTETTTDRVIVKQPKSGYPLDASCSDVFALLCKLAWPVLEMHHGDLFHDAAWLRGQIKGDTKRFAFHYNIRPGGTWPSLNGWHGAGIGEDQHWYIIFELDERERSWITAVRMDVEPRARFSGCDYCGEKVPTPYEHSTTRPSDSSSLCCVVAVCGTCEGNVELLYDVQSARVEAGYYKGVCFYE